MILSKIDHRRCIVLEDCWGAVMNRGERSANKTKSAIKRSLKELIREKNYPTITVSEITERGDVGRSTFYNHYTSKADVMVDIHKDTFEYLLSSLTTAESWLSPEPPQELVSFFETSKREGRNPFSLSYKLGSDLDFLIGTINAQLTKTVEAKLLDAFADGDGSIPVSVLAESVSSLYSGLIMAWFTQFQSSDIRQFATYIHRMSGALIYEAFGGPQALRFMFGEPSDGRVQSG